MKIALTTATLASVASAVSADPLTCDLTRYKALPGLTAAVADNMLAVRWDGDRNQDVRLRLAITDRTPTIRDLAVRAKGGQWTTAASNATPDFQVVSGVRRATDQQLKPLKDLGVPITLEVLDRVRWEAFWDSPLNVPGDSVAHGGATPPVAGIANQPGLPRNTSNLWVDYQFGGTKHDGPVPLKTANRLVAVEAMGGSIAAFPPPHNFFWARETEFNLGYNWYRKDSDASFGFGVRQAEGEEDPAWQGNGPEDRRQNYALYSARPGTWQRMAVYLYVSPEPAQSAIQSALAFTRDYRYKSLTGYQVMATHFHIERDDDDRGALRRAARGEY